MYLKRRTLRNKETVEELVLSRQEESELGLHSYAVFSQQSYLARGNRQHTPVSSELDFFVIKGMAPLMVPRFKVRKGLPISLGVLTLINSSQYNEDNRTPEN